TLVGIEDAWRPISLTPDLTLASLVGLVVPAAALVGFAAVPEERTYALLPVLLGIAGVSAVLGVAQVLSGESSPLYFYSITNNGSAVGLFSNRNHQAVLLAMSFPLLVLWIRQPAHQPGQRTLRLWVAGAAAVFLVPAVAMTGSRAGLLLAVVGLGFAWLHFGGFGGKARAAGRASAVVRRFPLLAKAAPVIGGLGVLAMAAMVSRMEAIERLFGEAVTEDQRIEASATLFQMARDFFPWGSGFGSFDPLFRVYEPFALLNPRYFNHAHNDLAEMAITGGLPALILIAWFLVWAAPRLLTAFRRPSNARAQRFAAFSGALIVLVLLSSLVDYPLRTPLMSALFALGCGWLAQSGSRSRSPEERL
ncbi:MAG: O-antigen ligase family protein, partial [Sphingomonas sp.]